MYVKLGMFFKSEIDAPDFGSISMYFVGPKEQGYVEDGNKKIRKYTLLSTDLNKLNNITNALDGSEALAVDTGNSYILSNNTWSLKSAGLTPTDVAEILGNITQIDYQVVNQLPQIGIKGTIYLVAHSHGDRDIYDEYIWTKDDDNNNIYEKIGNTDIDLTNYVNKNEIQYLSQYQYDNLSSLEKNNNNIYITNEGFFSNNNVIYRKSIALQPPTVDFNDSNLLLVGEDLPGQYFYRRPGAPITFTNAPTSFSQNTGFLLKVQTHRGSETNQTYCIQTLIQSETVFRRIVMYYSRYGGSYSYGDWEKIYPIEDFIPKVTNETGEVPKFKSDGTLESSGFTIESSVPSNAVFTDTTYNAATQSANGLMSSADKTKLDGININNYSMKSDAVVCTEDEYNSLATKTAEFYYIIQED